MGIRFEESCVAGSGGRSCSGISIHLNGLDEYLSGRVRERYYGSGTLKEEFPDIPTTGFGNKGLGIRSDPEPWEVGESLSECLLEDYRGVRLPYPSWQDLKNQNTSPTGADLVGYDYPDGSAVFLFGEVKTSPQAQHPPSVMYDLKRQLQDLGSPKTLQQLICWLGFKIKTEEDRQDFGQALKSYVKHMFKIVGILVRDTAFDKRDLSGVFRDLNRIMCPSITLELLAVYLPVAIDKIPRMMDGGRSRA